MIKRKNVTRILGQNMLVDRKVLAKIIESAKIDKEEIVCEAGTGQGTLTAELCRSGKQVVSYEVDNTLFEKAKKQLQFANLQLVHADLFKIGAIKFDVFVSNLPYSRSRDAFHWLATQDFDRAIVMVQNEFAEKLAAEPGDKKYRAISAVAAYCFKIEKLFKVSRQSFEPKPKVESAVLRILPINSLTKETIKNINLLFSQRNRKASSVAAKAGVTNVDLGGRRVDQTSAEKLMRVAEAMGELEK